MTGRIGGKTITRLLAHFGSLEAVISASEGELKKIPQIGPATAAAIIGIDIEQIHTMCAELKRDGIKIVTWEDSSIYPTNLLHCDDAPPVLFFRGTVQASENRTIAIIGTREPTKQSAALAHLMSYELANRGWTIISGLALGIDAAAHNGALDAKGRTIAVLGSGIQRIYPPIHTSLAAQISSSGAVISELHPDEQVSPQTLIARNRITSGLSRAVIVVQSGEDSGSMSTARRAQQQGRGVFAVLGGDSGCYQLLENGAIPIDPDKIDFDILSEQVDRLNIGEQTTRSSQLPLL
jgi:DNA processing protein